MSVSSKMMKMIGMFGRIAKTMRNGGMKKKRNSMIARRMLVRNYMSFYGVFTCCFGGAIILAGCYCDGMIMLTNGWLIALMNAGDCLCLISFPEVVRLGICYLNSCLLLGLSAIVIVVVKSLNLVRRFVSRIDCFGDVKML